MKTADVTQRQYEVIVEYIANLTTSNNVANVFGVSSDKVKDAIDRTDLIRRVDNLPFNDEVALLVDGVTKLNKIAYVTKEEVQAENVRKMLVAMTKDIRVILIKLADRLHNMRTMQYQTPAKQVEKARETLDIYVPFAERFGVFKIKWELEDLCLRYLDNDAYYELVGMVSSKRSEREAFMAQVVGEISEKLEAYGIKHYDCDGRPKHFYSIYCKMKNNGKAFSEIYDLIAKGLDLKLYISKYIEYCKKI